MAGIDGDDVLSGGFGYELPAITDPSELKRMNGHKTFHLKLLYVNKQHCQMQLMGVHLLFFCRNTKTPTTLIFEELNEMQVK